MKLNDFIRGLQILQPHYADPTGYHVGAEHDQFFAYATDTPLTQGEVAELKSMGWFQPDADDEDSEEGGDEDDAPYDPAEGWSAWV